ncbi:hypothetical protein DFJ73DRAFT_768068 [Zopfochytrium polystomum]|nr:hypothetical protein DFJ73DRAFT_768068 [Zopfochytrium polystomum]
MEKTIWRMARRRCVAVWANPTSSCCGRRTIWVKEGRQIEAGHHPAMTAGAARALGSLEGGCFVRLHDGSGFVAQLGCTGNCDAAMRLEICALAVCWGGSVRGLAFRGMEVASRRCGSLARSSLTPGGRWACDPQGKSSTSRGWDGTGWDSVGCKAWWGLPKQEAARKPRQKAPQKPRKRPTLPQRVARLNYAFDTFSMGQNCFCLVLRAKSGPAVQFRCKSLFVLRQFSPHERTNFEQGRELRECKARAKSKIWRVREDKRRAAAAPTVLQQFVDLVATAPSYCCSRMSLARAASAVSFHSKFDDAMCASVPPLSPSATRLQLASCTGGANQQFSFQGKELVLDDNSLCMDLFGSNVTIGAVIQVFTCHATQNQLWDVVQVDSTYVQVRTSLDAGFCLNVRGYNDAGTIILGLSQCSSDVFTLWRAADAATISPTFTTTSLPSTLAPGGTTTDDARLTTTNGGSAPAGTEAKVAWGPLVIGGVLGGLAIAALAVLVAFLIHRGRGRSESNSVAPSAPSFRVDRGATTTVPPSAPTTPHYSGAGTSSSYALVTPPDPVITFQPPIPRPSVVKHDRHNSDGSALFDALEGRYGSGGASFGDGPVIAVIESKGKGNGTSGQTQRPATTNQARSMVDSKREVWNPSAGRSGDSGEAGLPAYGEY